MAQGARGEPSTDPDILEKLNHIRTILSSLRPDEAFFSIDEFGPFAVKMKPGRTLTAPGTTGRAPVAEIPRLHDHDGGA